MQGAQQWYMAIGGHQVGPVSQDEIIANLRNGSIDAETLVFTPAWRVAEGRDVPAFAAVRRRAAPRGAVPPRRRRRRAGARTTSTSRSTATRCSSSRSSSIPAKARSPKPAR